MSVLLEHRPQRLPGAGVPSLADVLAEIAETAAETLELQEVFDRVATAVHRLIPFDNMGVVRILEGQWAVLHATTVPCDDHDAKCTQPEPLASWSPRFRPRPGPMSRIDDAERELDPAFPMDASLLEWGVRSALWEPFRMAEGWSGGVWLCAYRPYAFTAEHQEVLRPIAALLGSAVEHWRIWDAERRRRERLDRLETLVGALAESLDVREVFARLSAAVQPVLAHHLLVLTELDLRGRTIRVVAFAGETDVEVPTEPVPLTAEETSRRSQDFEIVRDIPAELAPDTDRQRLAHGLRDALLAARAGLAVGRGAGEPRLLPSRARALRPGGRRGRQPPRRPHGAAALAPASSPRRRGSPPRRASAPSGWRRRSRR